LLNKYVEDFTYMNYLHNCSLNRIIFENGVFNIMEYNINPLEKIEA